MFKNAYRLSTVFFIFCLLVVLINKISNFTTLQKSNHYQKNIYIVF